MRAAACLAALALAGCAGWPGDSGPPEVHRYVLLGPEGVVVARALTTDARCPALELDGGAHPMHVRMPPQTIAQRPTRSGPARSKPSAFPVLTCDAIIPPATANATIDGRALPLPRSDPRRIVVLGDTGCRVASGDGVFQGCNDPAQWPFQRIAVLAAAMRPDLVIHVGDYHYRETACQAGHPGCAGSPWGYGWDAWRADFFEPAQGLLAAAPWIVMRGNHESCDRAGQGWWRFLDPRPVAAGQDCDAAIDDDRGDFSEPYAVPLGADGQFLVFDSSRVGVTPLAPTDPMYRIYQAQLRQAFALGSRTPDAYFMSHHPVLAFAANPRNPHAPFPGNGGLQSVLTALYADALFPPNVQALLSGHNHVFEAVNFASPHPPQIVSGNGGDWVDEAFPVPFPAGLEPAPGAVVDELVASNRFGFLTMERTGTRWRIEAWDVHGAALTTCTLGARQLHCAPIATPWVRP
jgi:hypothetical protein